MSALSALQKGSVYFVLVCLFFCAAPGGTVRPKSALGAGYVSPYSVAYTCNSSSLGYDFTASPRNNTHLESSLAHAEWYDRGSSYYTNHALSWGPPAAQYPAVSVPTSGERGCDEATWKRERLIAVAQKYLGYSYQHHHIPDFNPYAVDTTWPPSDPAVLEPHPIAGLDCSNFSSWNYNYAHGIKLNSSIVEQGATNTGIPGPGGEGAVNAQVLGQGADYATLVSLLKTGDLLYIRSGTGQPISHVVMWVGAIGSGSEPLVIDSHDNSPVIKDSNGEDIPPGVHLRPFRESEYYFHQFDHAHRLIDPVFPVPSLRLEAVLGFGALLLGGGILWLRRARS